VTDIRLATSTPEVSDALAVRTEVFVHEQGVPRHLEIDELDDTADHFVAYDAVGVAVGAGRLVVEPAGFEGAPSSTGPVAHLGRLAVRDAARGTGLGVALVRAIEEQAQRRGLRVIALSAQTYAIGFYERLGYAAHGPEFDDAGLPHRWMTRTIDAADARAKPRDVP
jgi:predicted GNAT family N-acyltransferase